VVELFQASRFSDFLCKVFGHFGNCLGEMVKIEW
jgi:hypothetical protein